MEGRTWLFDKHLLVLKQPEGSSQPISMPFNTEVFWPQFHNVLIRCINKHFGLQIGGSLREVEEVEMDVVDTGCRSF